MRKFGILLVIVLLLALVPAVLAGGWAVITLDEPPGEIRAGEPWTIGFTVRQHGETPVHEVFDGIAVEPRLIATHAVTGERVSAIASPTEEVGHFTLEVAFPGEGEWSWTIEPAPLMGETQFEPLNVLPAVAVPAGSTALGESPASQPALANSPAAPTVEAASPLPAALRWSALFVALGAAGLLAVQLRRRGQLQAGAETR